MYYKTDQDRQEQAYQNLLRHISECRSGFIKNEFYLNKTQRRMIEKELLWLASLAHVEE